ncbi:hypothetical protein GIB67_012618 [Kingdonia uniflora]|uniref:DUF1985 domain-containing protein n=1 Tax=Kingdonia uniflora TaxID=39325 RepID=A0A7J7NER8_9MAGN|nr:hypothetical protein GIB67_012618 [Kingdonia uniflora]
MKSDKEVNEQFDEESLTQEGGAKKGTSNVKNYTSQCTSVGLNKIFGALPEEEKCVLRTTCFVPLLLINPMATMPTLVVEIFDRHLDDILRLNLLKNILSFHLSNKRRNVEVKYVDLVDDLVEFNRFPWGFVSFYLLQRNHIKAPTIGGAPAIDVEPVIEPPTVGTPVIGSSFSTTEIRAVVDKDEVEVEREVNLEAISSIYGGDRLEWKKGDEKNEKDDDDDEKDGKEKAKSFEEGQPQVAEEEEVQETSVDQTTGLYVEEQSKKEVVEGKDDDDGTSQKKPDLEKIIKEMVVDQTNLVLMESEVDVTLKKRHKLTDEDITEKSPKFYIQMSVLHVQAINVYVKALIQYFDSQHRVCPAKEKIVLADVYSSQIMGMLSMSGLKLCHLQQV